MAVLASPLMLSLAASFVSLPSLREIIDGQPADNQKGGKK
jgi:hypothetical protein